MYLPRSKAYHFLPQSDPQTNAMTFSTPTIHPSNFKISVKDLQRFLEVSKTRPGNLACIYMQIHILFVPYFEL